MSESGFFVFNTMSEFSSRNQPRHTENSVMTLVSPRSPDRNFIIFKVSEIVKRK
jgi:hypothetical protein